MESKGTRKPKIPSKNRSKEEKETKKAFEAIAKKLLKEQLTTFQAQMRSIIASNMDSVRHDLISIESSLSSRIISVESKLAALSDRVEELSMHSKKSFETLQEQQVSNNDLIKSNFELERTKRAAHIKKLQEKMSLIHSETQDAVQAMKKEQESAFTNLHDSIRVQTRDISSLQEKVDELYISKFGYIPKSKASSSQQAAPPTGSVLDHMSQRMERIERAMSNFDEDQGLNTENSFTNVLASPSRNSLSFKSTVSRIRKLEENLQSVQNQLQQTEVVVSQLKYNDSKSQQKGLEGFSSETLTRVLLDVKDTEKKVKRLAENTSRACRSLSQGLSDVQQATLNLYTWSDQVHDTLNVITTKVGLPEGMCDRAKVHRRRPKTSASESWDA